MQLLSQPLASPQLIARALHLEALQDVLGDASAGGGRCVVLTAEAGGGKSRLLQELCASPGVAGYWLLQGNCTENSADLPYASLHDLLRRYLAPLAPQERATALGPLAGELVGLLPELAWGLPGMAPSANPIPELERQRLHEALMQFLVQLAATRPVLMIVEDIHWSDEASLEFLHLLARR
ncbi:MAG: ATP-binding protein, partial [Anaerolineae bacterium]|nr:ATP-binding protein [Anaerolineae bacterium]